MIDWPALGADEIRRVHGNDERVSPENITAGVRADTEMLLVVAGP